MKKIRFISFSLGTLVAGIFNMLAHAQQPATNYSTGASQNNATIQQNQPNVASQSMKVGIVNTKKCLEESKLGKQEQANFDKMKSQMETVLQGMEKSLEEVETKLNDDDYMDSISDEAASELKRKRRSIRNEGMQLQNQYMQALQQANVKIVQKLTEVIAKASAQVAQDTTSGQPLDVIFTDEAATYFTPRLDVSDRIIAKMNAITDAEQKDSASKQR